MRAIIFAVIVFMSTSANAADAVWTGKFDVYDQTSAVWKWDCEYSYQGKKFWRVYSNYCPRNIGVND